MRKSSLLASFRYALEGLKYTLVTQQNMRIHFLAALGVLLFSLWLPLTKVEVLILFVCILLVIVAELINTAVEAVIDLVTRDFHPLAKVAKDVAAGAVLLSAGMAVVVGLSIFYPYLDILSLQSLERTSHPLNIGLAALIVFDFFLTLSLKGIFNRIGRPEWEPSMTMSLASLIAASLMMMTANWLVIILVLLLYFLLLGTRLQMKTRKQAVLLGVFLGVVIAVAGFFLM
ncbi:diacylglycerol kinase family protein [Kroppenstedtia eburnea]|uniref:Diacylglycerol kinase (ATP) n=1 Tax=Kroppenstedtia eburnea TaxID=714067 RepID=A0A1N7PQH2_9BACL|nr:diacylglycerol kinase family protein [Kroppenstedtia eburnea]QKI82715.1 diacylglycerol kinase family protein [Kroppenstedtia eburnea]SIT12790.1 diacylglycerol kinase (ATP) [Kroppenstedtia eburnea]